MTAPRTKPLPPLVDGLFTLVLGAVLVVVVGGLLLLAFAPILGWTP